MAQDLRKLLREDSKVSNQKMPQGHEARFLEKLDEQLPVVESSQKNQGFSFIKIAASIVLLIGLGYITYSLFGDENVEQPTEIVETDTKTLEDVSPELKKVEDYYLASINAELAKIEYTPETKELFDGYIKRLGELTEEYDRLTKELVETGPNENTVNALIDNLKLRLDLLYRLKQKLVEFKGEGLEQQAQTL